MSNSGNDYLYKDHETPKLDHPDALIRLASVVHRWKVPHVPDDTSHKKVSFVSSFSTAGRHDKTRRLCKDADEHRQRLLEACSKTNKLSGERIVHDAKRYIPNIHNILVYVLEVSQVVLGLLTAAASAALFYTCEPLTHSLSVSLFPPLPLSHTHFIYNSPQQHTQIHTHQKTDRVRYNRKWHD
jgi:hypothetical protein